MRFELKYIIPEAQALFIRDYVQAYLQPDPYGAQQENCSYPVHSIYLDSSDYYLRQSTINGDRNRFKLRIRFYENGINAPVYLEIKRRQNSAIYKERCPVSKPVAAEVVAGHVASMDSFTNLAPHEQDALRSFCAEVHLLQAKPVCHVAYIREAWLGPEGNRIRVTFDRNVRSAIEREVNFSPRLNEAINVFGNNVVLELKFTGRFPSWMAEMVRAFGLQQCSAAKYVDGFNLLSEHSFLHTYL